jgi:hypothetical protein
MPCRDLGEKLTAGRSSGGSVQHHGDEAEVEGEYDECHYESGASDSLAPACVVLMRQDLVLR